MDESRRKLERRALTGDAEAEAKLLQQRLRSSEVSQVEIDLAAYCGHQAALSLSAGDQPAQTEDARQALAWLTSRLPHYESIAPTRRRTAEWLIGLAHWGFEPCLRAGVAAARYGLSLGAVGDGPLGLSAIRATEAWIIEPGPSAAGHAEQVYSLIVDTLHEEEETWAAQSLAEAVFLAEALQRPRGLMRVLRSTKISRPAPYELAEPLANCIDALIASQSVISATRHPEHPDTLDANELEIEREVRAVVEEELAAWALGHRDPIRDRGERP